MEIDNVQAIIDTAQAAASVRIHHIAEPTVREAPIPAVAVSQGSGKVALFGVKAILDEWRTAPDRKKGTAKVNTIESLTELTGRHKDADSVIFADIDAAIPSVTSIFDYHTVEGAPRYGQHRATYLFPLSPEWKAWKKADGVSMAQAEWAAFIEEHIAELASPLDAERTQYEALFGTKIATPAELIGLSRGLQLTVESKIRDFRTLQSGEIEVSYEEVHRDGRGEKLIVPGLFIAHIPFFVDAAANRILARLRYRKANGTLQWFFQLYRAEQELRAAMRLEAEHVSEITGLPLYEGTPEA